MSELEKRQKDLLEELHDFEDWKERYNFILDLGDEMPEMPEALKVEANLVKGCVSKVWLQPERQGEKISFLGDSDSLFVKGLVGVLVKLYSGLDAKEIAHSDSNFLVESGLIENLSPNRVNGAAALLQKIKDYAKS